MRLQAISTTSRREKMSSGENDEYSHSWQEHVFVFGGLRSTPTQLKGTGAVCLCSMARTLQERKWVLASLVRTSLLSYTILAVMHCA